MPLKIKVTCDADNHYQLVARALRAGGNVLNGANELNNNGEYNAIAPPMSLHNDTFILSDKWFNGQPQDIDTVTKAVEAAVGIKLKFVSQMLSSEPPTISSYEIVNQEKYDATIKKLTQFYDAIRLPFSSS
jgi:hypothetical protein